MPYGLSILIGLTDYQSVGIEHVTYGNNNKGRILGVEKIGMNSSTCIENVLLVDGLKHNLLSVSQLCVSGVILSMLL